MKNILISTTIAIASLSLLATTYKPAWSNQAPRNDASQPPARNAPVQMGELQSVLAENEQRLKGIYRELHGAQELLQQAGQALYRAQAEHQESTRIQRMLGNRISAAAADNYRNNQARNTRAAGDWEIERYRAFAQNIENERSKLQQALEERDQQIAALNRKVNDSNAVSQQAIALDKEQQLATLRGELETKTVELQNALQQAADARDIAQQAIHEQDLRDRQIVALEKQLNEARSATAQYLDSEQEHGKKLVELNAQLEQARQSLEETGKALEDSRKATQQVKNEQRQRDQQIVTLKKELDEARVTAIQTRERQDEQDQLLISVKTELEETRAQLGETGKVLEETRGVVTQARAELDVRDQQLANLGQELDETRRAAEQSSSEQEQQLAELTTELANKHTALTGAQEQILNSQESLLDVNIRLEEARTQQIALTQELETMRATNAMERKFMDDTLAVRNHLKARLSSCNATLTQVRTSFASLQTTEVSPAIADTETIAYIQAANSDSSSEVAQLDADGDGLIDVRDLCTQTPPGKKVGASGCELNVPISLQGVTFRYDSSELTPESKTLLDHVAAVLNQQQNLTHEVAGHTDSQGDAAYNMWLSQQRAEAVKNYLMRNGVESERLIAVGYGGSRPVGDNKTWEGLTSNRRVELRWLP